MKNDENWCRLPYSIIADENLSHFAMIVYAIMLDKKKKGSEDAKITVRELMKLTKQSESTTKRAIKQLKKTGYIKGVKQKQGKEVYYTIKSILPDKRQKQKPEQEQLEFDTPDSSGTFETDLTPEQVRKLSELLATKLSSNNRSPERIDKLLRTEYAKMKIHATKEVDNAETYLAKMISNWEHEPEPNKKEEFDAEKYAKICINNYEVI